MQMMFVLLLCCFAFFAESVVGTYKKCLTTDMDPDPAFNLDDLVASNYLMLGYGVSGVVDENPAEAGDRDVEKECAVVEYRKNEVDGKTRLKTIVNSAENGETILVDGNKGKGFNVENEEGGTQNQPDIVYPVVTNGILVESYCFDAGVNGTFDLLTFYGKNGANYKEGILEAKKKLQEKGYEWGGYDPVCVFGDIGEENEESDPKLKQKV